MAKPASNVSFLPLGAVIQEFSINGLNIVQNFATAEQYKQYNKPFFGETIGRVANRISDAKINSLNGTSYALAANNGPNSLHGGDGGWGKREFQGPTPINKDGKEAVVFKYQSPDGEGGYPGTVELKVIYSAYTEKVDGVEQTVLEAEYEAELVGPDNVQETVIGLTNHSYFNLSGAPSGHSIAGTEVTLSTDKHLPVNENTIPTGKIEPFPGLTAGKPFSLGEKEPQIDHCFIMNPEADKVPVDTRSQPLQRLAAFYQPTSKVHLEVHSTEPAFQFYTGNFLNVPEVDGIPARGPRTGFCVEPSRYVNAANVEEWKDQVLLKRGDKYGSKFVYRAWIA
ncbi:galactose mutarotase-like domain-containing protein [Phyllosticta citrichinensis]|uniref:Galactose mutarotase-like domain-containing protein n=1 Tax=Phyllosticta citrichinensis TaxID=1130410 RepID=A0ABR1XRP7_9PEZI